MIKIGIISIIIIISIYFIFYEKPKPTTYDKQHFAQFTIENYSINEISNLNKFSEDIKKKINNDIIDYILCVDPNLNFDPNKTLPNKTLPNKTLPKSINVLIFYKNIIKDDTEAERYHEDILKKIDKEKENIKITVIKDGIEKTIPIKIDKENIKSGKDIVKKEFNDIIIKEKKRKKITFDNIQPIIKRSIHVGRALPFYYVPQIRNICSMKNLPNDTLDLNKVNYVEKIPDSFLKNCKIINKIVINDKTKIIEDYSFLGCNNLETVIFGNESILRIIKKGAFKFTNIKTINIPKYVKWIENEVFYACENLETINFNNNSKLTYLGNLVFFKCKKLKSINLPKSLETIGENIFKGCINLLTIKLPNKFKIINDDDKNTKTLEFLGLTNNIINIIYY